MKPKSNYLTLIELQKIQELLDEDENCKSIAIVLQKTRELLREIL